ncbi:hypothetical protein DYB25_003918 [Aphanomyces astaci]|uniref:Uncharacterized protein n=2 Tax=Aphanomyces astaci TaxID=112090 RepID=A0A397EQV3_APHAT|nr:hypothetical protein DYB25_003918 [Aphanomyces astaci]RHY50054.1 hypothetical protein DYB30_005710 [Aphanomyces astaci]RHY55705.1 hypothetical protein DYB38_003287 [Aphanomyces astaci]RHY67562.1 hypothetical protein DYB34_002052 [Aphanomyces astaci]RHY81627.1 hypothetical protein DYB26_007239 [Aphanomyces astaci]
MTDQGCVVSYGELVVLGYSSYKRRQATSATVDKSQWVPVGAPNCHFGLVKRPVANALVPTKTVLVESSLQKRAFTHALDHALQATSSRYVCVPVTDTATLVTEYAPSTANQADMFQLGRQPSPCNDFVVPGHLHGAKGTVARFTARIVCDRTPPYTCRVFAGGFDSDHQVMVPLNAPKFCPTCQQWTSTWSRDHAKCILPMASTSHGGGSSGDDLKITVCGIQSSTGSTATHTVDALTRNGLRLWRPDSQTWAEVSVHGSLYAVPTASSSTSFARPTSSPITTEAVLMHGSILDIGGVYVKFVLRPSSRPVTSLLLELTTLHCPVQLTPLHFTNHHPQAKPQIVPIDKDQVVPAYIPRGLQPHVYPACGHVCGYNAQMASSCPLCRTPSSLVPLQLAPLNGHRLVCDDVPGIPGYVFNPCGHMTGAALAAEAVALRVQSSGKSICPFCAKTLDSLRPYSKLYFYIDDDDDHQHPMDTVGAIA